MSYTDDSVRNFDAANPAASFARRSCGNTYLPSCMRSKGGVWCRRAPLAGSASTAKGLNFSFCPAHADRLRSEPETVKSLNDMGVVVDGVDYGVDTLGQVRELKGAWRPRDAAPKPVVAKEEGEPSKKKRGRPKGSGNR